MRPRIGITGRRWPAGWFGSHVPEAMAGLEIDVHFADYAAAVAAAGGVPLQLTRDADVEDVADLLDGLVLSGGADVDPALYGAAPEDGLGTLEPARDSWELALLAAAEHRDLPILAICRGLQMVNVARGGSLRQDVPLVAGRGHPQWARDAHEPSHAVTTVPGSRLRELVGEEAAVNSLHHQVVAEVGTGLVVTAWADDGEIESLESVGGRILAVQWHPELLGRPDPTFTWVVDAARARRA
ncbi:MAG: gamma-glutamyl-gamma-aminobutyrate hydrolase family protein [Acidimicrobiales bacterium]